MRRSVAILLASSVLFAIARPAFAQEPPPAPAAPAPSAPASNPATAFDPEDYPNPPPPPPVLVPVYPVVPLPPNRVVHFAGSIEVGPAWQHLFADSFVGGSVEALIGARRGDWDWGGTLELMDQKTSDGLGVLSFHAGILTERHFGRLGLGIAARVGGMELRRATANGTIDAMTAGVGGRASFDVLQFAGEPRAIYLVVKGSVDLEPETSVWDVGVVFGVSGGVGIRF